MTKVKMCRRRQCVWSSVVITLIILTSQAQGFSLKNADSHRNMTKNPSLRDIVIGPCRWVNEKRPCPDENVQFYLYTRHNPMDRQTIYIDDSLDKSNLTSSYFQPENPTKILIHGYNADMFMHPLFTMKEEYLAIGDYNLLYVEWIKYAPAPCYLSAVHNTRHVGRCIAQLVDRMVDLKNTDIHVIGFSLGAQVTNFIARNLPDFQLPRISGLDPAMPLFVTNDINLKLDPTDAEFVDVYHTNALVQGKIEQCGHADFYFNGGITQPGCDRTPGTNIFACSHNRALLYYLESIRTKKGFWGWSCSSYMSFLLGMCPETNYLFEGGEHVKKDTTRGMFLVKTNDTSPFALGKWTDLPTLGVKTKGAYKREPPTLVLRPPPQMGDPILRNIDLWGKIDAPFNYYEGHVDDASGYANSMDDLWTNFTGTIEVDNGGWNSVEELTDDTAVPHDMVQWDQYRENLTEGIIDPGVFRMPQFSSRT